MQGRGQSCVALSVVVDVDVHVENKQKLSLVSKKTNKYVLVSSPDQILNFAKPVNIGRGFRRYQYVRLDLQGGLKKKYVRVRCSIRPTRTFLELRQPWQDDEGIFRKHARFKFQSVIHPTATHLHVSQSIVIYPGATHASSFCG